VIAIRHASRIYDLPTIRGMHDASGRSLRSVDPDFEPTKLHVRFT
jgi:hypothetical protein